MQSLVAYWPHVHSAKHQCSHSQCNFSCVNLFAPDSNAGLTVALLLLPEPSPRCHPHQPPQHGCGTPASVLPEPAARLVPAQPHLLWLLSQRITPSGAVLAAGPAGPGLHPGAGRTGKLFYRGHGRRGEGGWCCRRAGLSVGVHASW